MSSDVIWVCLNLYLLLSFAELFACYRWNLHSLFGDYLHLTFHSRISFKVFSFWSEATSLKDATMRFSQRKTIQRNPYGAKQVMQYFFHFSSFSSCYHSEMLLSYFLIPKILSWHEFKSSSERKKWRFCAFHWSMNLQNMDSLLTKDSEAAHELRFHNFSGLCSPLKCAF